MGLDVEHKVMKDRRGKIRVRKFYNDGYDHYMLKIFLTGSDLQKVDHVDYELHETFSDPIRSSQNSKTGFAMTIWTWGEFEIAVTVYMKDGLKWDVYYDLAYSNELPDDDNAYVDETPARLREG